MSVAAIRPVGDLPRGHLLVARDASLALLGEIAIDLECLDLGNADRRIGKCHGGQTQ